MANSNGKDIQVYLILIPQRAPSRAIVRAASHGFSNGSDHAGNIAPQLTYIYQPNRIKHILEHSSLSSRRKWSTGSHK